MSSTTATTKLALPANSTSARLRIEVFVWRHGLLWLVNSALIAVLGAVWLSAVRPWQIELATRAADITAAREQLARLQSSPRPETPESQRRTVVEILPPRSSLDAQVREIYELGRQHQLSFSKTTYRTMDIPRLGIVRVQMRVPVHNQYPPLADFIEDLLRRYPNVTVDQLRLRRDSIAQSEGEAQLEISVWGLRQSGTAQTPGQRRETNDQ